MECFLGKVTPKRVSGEIFQAKKGEKVVQGKGMHKENPLSMKQHGMCVRESVTNSFHF